VKNCYGHEFRTGFNCFLLLHLFHAGNFLTCWTTTIFSGRTPHELQKFCYDPPQFQFHFPCCRKHFKTSFLLFPVCGQLTFLSHLCWFLFVRCTIHVHPPLKLSYHLLLLSLCSLLSPSNWFPPVVVPVLHIFTHHFTWSLKMTIPNTFLQSVLLWCKHKKAF